MTVVCSHVDQTVRYKGQREDMIDGCSWLLITGGHCRETRHTHETKHNNIRASDSDTPMDVVRCIVALSWHVTV